jgi:hypothetical protein
MGPAGRRLVGARATLGVYAAPCRGLFNHAHLYVIIRRSSFAAATRGR